MAWIYCSVRLSVLDWSLEFFLFFFIEKLNDANIIDSIAIFLEDWSEIYFFFLYDTIELDINWSSEFSTRNSIIRSVKYYIITVKRRGVKNLIYDKNILYGGRWCGNWRRRKSGEAIKRSEATSSGPERTQNINGLAPLPDLTNS